MNARAELLDIEAQTADHNRAQRSELAAAAPDPLDAAWINGRAYDPDDLPDARDLAEMETWR